MTTRSHRTTSVAVVDATPDRPSPSAGGDPPPGDRWPKGTGLSSEDREREYSPSTRLPDRDLGPFLDRYRDDSAAARDRYPYQVVAYGPAPANTIDLFLPPSTPQVGPVPLHVFVHGGYWQQLSKLDSSFLAPACLARGQAFAAIDYTLAPEVTLATIVAETVAALQALRCGVAGDRIDTDAIVVSGSSAGAHLAARATQVLDAEDRPAGLVLASGIYLLEPLIGTTINDAVGLDAEAARADSPLLHPVDGFPPTVVAWGDDETDEFKRQSRALVDRLTRADTPTAEIEVAGRNHFDVVFDIVPALVDRLSA